MQTKVKILNNNSVWNPKKRYKVNEVVELDGSTYQNTTGKNSNPTLLTDWVSVFNADLVAHLVTKTKVEIDTLISGNDLVPLTVYEITGVDTALYGGSTIYLQAITDNTLAVDGIGKFYNPKYNQAVSGFDVWTSARTYAIGDKVHWGGKTWENVAGNVGASTDLFTLDSEWSVISFNSTDYKVAYDAIKYDYANDVIIYRNEQNSNIVSTSVGDINENWIGLYGNPIKVFQWGNVYNPDITMGIGSQNIINSYNENINFRGIYQINLSFNLSRQSNITFDNNSYQSNLTFDNNSGQNNLTFDNGSGQNYLTFDNGSYQNYLTFDNGSYQSNLTFDNNSHQENLTFDNNSYQGYLTFDNGSGQNNLTFNNGSYQNYLTFDNNSYQSGLTFDNSSGQIYLTFDNGSGQNNLTFDNGSGQNNLTFNNGSYQSNLTFDNGSYQSNLTFDNNSHQENLTFDNNSGQNNLTFDNGSGQNNLTFNNGSYQSNLTFDNNSYQGYLTFDNGSGQNNLTFNNGSYQNYLTFDNNSYQSGLTFDNSSGQSNLTETTGLFQERIISNNYQFNRSSSPIIANEIGLIFSGTLPTSTTATKMIVAEYGQWKEMDIFSGYVVQGVDNATTVVLTSATLNSTYSTATIGFRVYCASIIVGAMTYEKTPSGWLGFTCIVP